MKGLKKILLLLSFLAFASTSNAQIKESGKAEIKVSIECDHCKQCETCGGNFKDHMLKIKGVKMYELDEDKKKITVYYNTKKTNLQTIKTAISKMGFDADDVKADPEAYEKLDNCCKA